MLHPSSGGSNAVGSRTSPGPVAAWSSRRGVVALAAVAVVALAVAARLLPVLRGGGLHGLANYDDGVHYAAAAALVHGELPYRDFLLLHPPGIVVLLAPFAALGLLVGDADGFATARLAWMVLGGLNALLVGAVLRGLGPVAALVGALGYAVFFPAVYSEHTVLLEAPGTTGLLLSLLLLRVLDEEPVRAGRVRLLLAGACLGVTVTVKAWGLVPVLVVAAWLLLRGGGRAGRSSPARPSTSRPSSGRPSTGRITDALTYLAGAAGACVVVCLPFFLAAPGPMWRMVVLDQLGRDRSSRTWGRKLAELVGVSPWDAPAVLGLLAAALLVLVVATTWSLRHRRTRLPGVLVVVLIAVLLGGPTWFLHYPAFVAGPAWVVLGAAAGTLAAVLTRRAGRGAGRAVVALALAAALLPAAPLLDLRLADRFPGASLARALAPVPGCVAADDPTVLVVTDLLARNLDRGCPLVVDPGGYSYDLHGPGGAGVSRARDEVWQAWYLGHLRSADAVVTVRYTTRFGLSRATDETIRSWPVLAEVGGVVVRRPQPAG